MREIEHAMRTIVAIIEGAEADKTRKRTTRMTKAAEDALAIAKDTLRGESGSQ